MEYFINSSCSAYRHRFYFVLCKVAGGTLAFIESYWLSVKSSRVGFRGGQLGAVGRKLQAGSWAAVRAEAHRWLDTRVTYCHPYCTVCLTVLRPMSWGPWRSPFWGGECRVHKPEPSPVPKSRGSPQSSEWLFSTRFRNWQ